MKKLVSLFLVVVMITSVLTMSFVCADAQEYNFEDNRISLMLKQSGKYTVSLEKLSQFGVIEIEQMGEGWYYLTLDKHDHQNVLDVISAMEHADESYLYNVHVVYLPQEDPFADSEIKAKFVEEFGEPQIYEEIYFKYTDEEKTTLEWVFINAAVDIMIEPIENPVPHRHRIGDIIYSTIYYFYPFSIPYCVYDVKKDEFVEISEDVLDNYAGLSDVFCTSKYGKLIGDLDDDGVVNVIDATEIQRAQAQLSEITDLLLADFNRDNSVDIMDATAIQMKLVSISD